jgi:hypothetical protein
MRTISNGKGRLIRSHRRIPFFLFVTQMGALLHGSENSVHAGGGAPEAPLPTRAQISHAIALSAGYLERSR